MGLAFIPLYIRYLGIESYGLIGLFGVLQAWLSLLDMGMTPTLSREMARFTGGGHTTSSIRNLLRSIEMVVVAMAVLMMLGVGLSATWLANSWLRVESLPISIVAQSFVIMGVVTALRFIEGIYRSSIVGLQRQVLLNILVGVMSTIRSLGAVAVLIWVSPTINAFFIWQGLMALVSLIVLSLVTYATLPRASCSSKFSAEAIRNIWGFAGGMMAVTVLALLLTTVDKLILAKLLTLSEYGYFTLASVVAGALYMLVSPITGAWFPRLCQLHAASDINGLVRIYHQGAQLVTVVAGSAAAVILMNAEILLQLWTQDHDLAHRTAPLLSLLVFGNLLNAFMWMPYQCQLAYGWTGLGVRINIMAVIVIIPAIFWSAERYGVMGAAWVWISLNACYCLIGIHFMYRRILQSEKWFWYRHDILEPLVASISMAAFLKWLIPTPVESIFQISLLAGVSVLTIIVSGLAAKEVRQIFHKLWAFSMKVCFPS